MGPIERFLDWILREPHDGSPRPDSSSTYQRNRHEPETPDDGKDA